MKSKSEFKVHLNKQTMSEVSVSDLVNTVYNVYLQL